MDKRYVLDLTGVYEPEEFHERVAESLPVPEWYGGNLDALLDVLTDPSFPGSQIMISGYEDLKEAKPHFWKMVKRMATAAVEERDDLIFIFSGPSDESKDSAPTASESPEKSNSAAPESPGRSSSAASEASAQSGPEAKEASDQSGPEAMETSGKNKSEALEVSDQSRSEAMEASGKSRSETVEEFDKNHSADEETPESSQPERIVIITDLHGCYDECQMLLEKLSFDSTTDMLINLGDTIDRGPKIYEVFEFFRALKEEMGDRCVLIRGNHEQMMLDGTVGSRADKELWYYNSGEKTKFAFINHKHQIKEFRSWYEAMPYYYIDPKGRFIGVHACLEDEDPEKNSIETLIWGRETNYSGKLVLTGHTPYKMPLYFCGDAMGTIRERMWGELPEKGMIALDTGCVYGNRLTGMIIEGNAFYVDSVESRVKRK